ncbi:Uncharacterised protein [Klebsiella pneumoniae]|nr:Uncharacterised protein [Klebsiella pneumoniae]
MLGDLFHAITGLTPTTQQLSLDILLPKFCLFCKLLFERCIQLSIGRKSHPGILVFDGQSGAIRHRFMQAIFVDVLTTAELAQRVFVLLQQRCAGKGDELGVGQTGAHECREEVVLATVGLIDQHVEIGLGAEYPEMHLFPADFFPLRLHRYADLIHL